MRTRLASLFHRTVVAGGFSLVIPFSGMAADNAPPEALNVKVFPDRYVAAGKSFADLAGLEAWAKPILLRALWLDNCSPASTKQLLAASSGFIRRFRTGSRSARFAQEKQNARLRRETSATSWPRCDPCEPTLITSPSMNSDGASCPRQTLPSRSRGEIFDLIATADAADRDVWRLH